METRFVQIGARALEDRGDLILFALSLLDLLRAFIDLVVQMRDLSFALDDAERCGEERVRGEQIVQAAHLVLAGDDRLQFRKPLFDIFASAVEIVDALFDILQNLYVERPRFEQPAFDEFGDVADRLEGQRA